MGSRFVCKKPRKTSYSNVSHLSNNEKSTGQVLEKEADEGAEGVAEEAVFEGLTAIVKDEAIANELHQHDHTLKTCQVKG